MPAESRSQQRAAGMALSAKQGKISPKKLQGSAKGMYNSMSEEQLVEFASTPTQGLPFHKVPAARNRKYRVLGRNP